MDMFVQKKITDDAYKHDHYMVLGKEPIAPPPKTTMDNRSVCPSA